MAKDCLDTYKQPDLKKRAIVGKAKKKNGKKKVPPKLAVKKG